MKHIPGARVAGNDWKVRRVYQHTKAGSLATSAKLPLVVVFGGTYTNAKYYFVQSGEGF